MLPNEAEHVVGYNTQTQPQIGKKKRAEKVFNKTLILWFALNLIQEAVKEKKKVFSIC